MMLILRQFYYSIFSVCIDLNKKSVGKGYTPMHFAALCHYHSEIQTNDTDDQTDETNQGLETDGAVEEDLIKYLIENAAEVS